MPLKFAPKIALLGSGQIGGTIGLLCGLKKLTNNIVMLDVVDGMPMGKALDMGQALAAENVPCHYTGCSDISEKSEGLEGADIVIVTAGFPRKPNMSRDDLVAKNAEVISSVAKAIKTKCPDAFVICITNPLDVMVSLLQKTSGLPASRVVGMAGMLDSSRFRYFLAEALNVSVRDVNTMVLGGHGDEMVPVKSATSIAGLPLKTVIQMGMISEKKVDEIIERTRVGGGEIVELLRVGSAFVGPAACAMQMVESYLRDEKRIMPCCVKISGQYGVTDCYGGVPCIIGAGGVERVLEIPLDEEEKAMFAKSMSAVAHSRELCRKAGFEC